MKKIHLYFVLFSVLSSTLVFSQDRMQTYRQSQSGEYLFFTDISQNKTYFVQTDSENNIIINTKLLGKNIQGELKCVSNGLIFFNKFDKTLVMTINNHQLNDAVTKNLEQFNLQDINSKSYTTYNGIGIGLIIGPIGPPDALSCKCYAQVGNCDVGGDGASSCGIGSNVDVQGGVVSGGGGKSCSVNCGDGYSACCNN